MRRFGWTRLTWLLLVLTVLAALARLGGGAEARSLAERVPEALVVASETQQGRALAGLTADDLASLEDMIGDPQPTEGSTRPDVEPPFPSDPDPAEEARRPGGGQPRAVPAAEQPVFFRPARPGTEPGPVCRDLRGAPAGGKIAFPLERDFFFSYEDTWGAPRAQGGHEGTDLMTPTGAPEYAITDGTVVPVEGSDADGWNTLGGNAVMIRADYSIGPVKAGDLFYYAHLERESPLETGDRVGAGQVIGRAGDTGQGPPGTSGLFPPHLHLGWYDGSGGRGQADSGAMNPYPLLEWIRANGGSVSGGSDARFCEAPRSGPPTPSSGANDWPAPSSPGLTPDLDTDSDDPRPARAAPANRDGDPPARKPARSDRPNVNAAKPPSPDRPDPRKPERVEKNPQRPDRPDKDEQMPPRPSPPSNSAPGPTEPSAPPQDPGNPSNGQYEGSTGGSAELPTPRSEREQETSREPAADETKKQAPKQ